jgi:hypothetical protein
LSKIVRRIAPSSMRIAIRIKRLTGGFSIFMQASQ